MSSDTQTNQWALALHLSQFAGYLIPLAGVIAPILIWQMKKEEMPELDAHGKVVANWLISVVIYALICTVLTFVVIGVFMFMALAALAIAFPIVGAIKAQSGEVWKYPLSFSFIR